MLLVINFKLVSAQDNKVREYFKGKKLYVPSYLLVKKSLKAMKTPMKYSELEDDDAKKLYDSVWTKAMNETHLDYCGFEIIEYNKKAIKNEKNEEAILIFS